MNNKHWFILNGVARSGKDTFKECLSKHAKTVSISTVDTIKDICKQLGWNGVKDDSGRLALSDFKDLADKHFDHTFNYINTKLNEFMQSDNEIFTVDVREPEKIKRLVDEFNFKTIIINRDNISVPNNHADKDVNNYHYDYIIDNNGSISDLETCAVMFVDELE